MMLDPKTWLVVPALAVAMGVGCDSDKTPSAQDGRTGPAAATPAPASDAARTADARHTDGDHHDAADEHADPAPVVGGDHATDPPTPSIDPPAPAPQRAARRSPFPEEGERLAGPIAAPRLSDEDPFKIIIDPDDIPAVVPWEQAGDYVGHEITVEGRIVDIGQTRNADIFFLNFHADWRGKFYMVVFDDLADTLDQTVEEIFKDKLVRVRGLVETHRDRPQIKIESMDQVEFVEE